jgi:hypothetical protein
MLVSRTITITTWERLRSFHGHKVRVLGYYITVGITALFPRVLKFLISLWRAP